MTRTADAGPDPRVTPYRPDVAADFLKDQVAAKRFVRGVECTVAAGFAGLHGKPDARAELASQLLYGERFTVYDEKRGWAWGQNAVDGYVGYLRTDALTTEIYQPTHWLAAPAAFLFADADLKSPVLDRFSMLAAVMVAEERNGFAHVVSGGWLYARNLAPIGTYAADPVTTARRFLSVPYLWGGRSALGLDCSALVQIALLAAGIKCPRDSDQQRAALGTLISANGSDVALQRGDVIFFPGHVGLMTDATSLLHANAHHMAVVEEPLADVVGRGTEVIAVKRLALTLIPPPGFAKS